MRTVERPSRPKGVHAAPRRPDTRVRALVQGSVAVVVSGAVCLLARLSFPDDLDVRTDVVGYPIHSNFNVFGYFQTFYILVVAFPLGVLAVYHLLSLRRRRHRPPPLRPHRLAPSPSIDIDEPGSPQPARHAAGRVLFNGAVAGLALTQVVEPSTRFWPMVALAALLFTGLVAAAAATPLLPLAGSSFRWRLAAANALAVAAGLVLLGAVSAGTTMTVQSDDSVDAVPWMPWWLVLPAAVAAVAVVWRALARAGTDVDVRRIERRALLLVAAPVGLFLVFAQLPRPATFIDLFHDGEGLAAATLIGDGAFPWRDLFFIHGLLQDVFFSGLGLSAIQDSRWGALAGQMLLWTPVYWALQYALNVRLFGRNWLFLVLTAALALNGWLTPPDFRFLLQPLVLLLLAALLERATKPRAIALSVVAVVDLVVTPESAFLVMAAALVLIAFETYYREPGQRLVDRYRRTSWCAGSAVAALAVWFAYLAANGALGSFFLYYRTFAPDHVLTGGIPLNGDGLAFFPFALVAPPAVAVLTFWYVAARIRGRKPLAVEDWVVMAVALFVVAYYQKFLSRADGHIYQVLAVSLPMLYYALHKVIGAVEGALARHPTGGRALRATTRHPVTLALVAGVLFLAPGPTVDDRADWIPTSFDATVPDHPEVERLGYSLPGIVDEEMLADTAAVLGAVLRPGDRMFDMTNTPAVYHYLLGAEPVKRYFHLSMAIRAHTQHDLLDQLRRDRPLLVAMGGSPGLPVWDGVPNIVRHYDVSQYVLRTYRPWLTVRGVMFLVPRDLPAPPLDALAAQLSEAPSTDDLLLNGETCNWGHAPNFFADPGGPAADAPGTEVPFRTGMRGAVHELTLEPPPGLRLDQFSRLELETAEGLVDDSFVLSADPADDARSVQFKTLASNERQYRVRVGNCPQWYAFAGPTLSLRHQSPQQIVAVRLHR